MMTSTTVLSDDIARSDRGDSEFDRVLSEIATKRRGEHRRRTVFIWAMRTLVVVVFMGSWQFFCGDPRVERWALVDSYYVSKPSEILGTLRDWFADGSVWPHIWATTQATLYGFVLGALLGFLVGLALGSNRTLGQVLSPFVSALNSVPRLALVPLFILWFGLGLSSKVVFVTNLVFFLVFFSTFDGVRQRSQDLTNTLRVMGASRLQLLFKMTIPSAMSWVFSGLRVSVPFALVAAVTAEIISSNAGLGFLLVRSSNQFYVQGVFAAIVLMVVLAMAILGAVNLLERRLSRWISGGSSKARS